jgi:hypothetical protein
MRAGSITDLGGIDFRSRSTRHTMRKLDDKVEPPVVPFSTLKF